MLYGFRLGWDFSSVERNPVFDQKVQLAKPLDHGPRRWCGGGGGGWCGWGGVMGDTPQFEKNLK